jgi:hypothetical protein
MNALVCIVVREQLYWMYVTVFTTPDQLTLLRNRFSLLYLYAITRESSVEAFIQTVLTVLYHGSRGYYKPSIK